MIASSISIFISYSRTDSSFVDRLEADLQARNFLTWVDRRKLEGGQIWMNELEKAVKRCQIMLVILSPEAVQSQYVRMEYRYAQSLGKLVIPLAYRTCPEVPIDLNSLQWVNFQQIYEQSLNELLIALNPVRIADISTPAPAAAQLQLPSLAATSELSEVDLVPPQPALPRPEPSLMDLYRAGVSARAANDQERAAVLWQQVLDGDPQFQSGILAIQMQKLQEELHPLRVKRLRDRAREAHSAGEWCQEISAWQALLALGSGDIEAKTSVALAEKHQKYAWMYENAVQFVAEQALDAAKLQLEMLWQEDPEYSGPAGLGKNLGIIPPVQRFIRPAKGRSQPLPPATPRIQHILSRVQDQDITVEQVAELADAFEKYVPWRAKFLTHEFNELESRLKNQRKDDLIKQIRSRQYRVQDEKDMIIGLWNGGNHYDQILYMLENDILITWFLESYDILPAYLDSNEEDYQKIKENHDYKEISRQVGEESIDSLFFICMRYCDLGMYLREEEANKKTLKEWVSFRRKFEGLDIE